MTGTEWIVVLTFVMVAVNLTLNVRQVVERFKAERTLAKMLRNGAIQISPAKDRHGKNPERDD